MTSFAALNDETKPRRSDRSTYLTVIQWRAHPISWDLELDWREMSAFLLAVDSRPDATRLSITGHPRRVHLVEALECTGIGLELTAELRAAQRQSGEDAMAAQIHLFARTIASYKHALTERVDSVFQQSRYVRR